MRADRRGPVRKIGRRFRHRCLAGLVDGVRQHARIPHRSHSATLCATAWLAALLTACSPPPPTVPDVRPQVLATLPHDTTAFTEGLQRDGTTLWEGTGLAGESELRELDPTTGAVRPVGAAAGAAVGRGHRGHRRHDLAAHLPGRRRAAVGQGHAEGEEAGRADRRGLGAVLRRQPPRPERRLGHPPLPQPHDVRPDRRAHRDPRRQAGAPAERAGVRRAGRCGRTSGRPRRSCASTRRAAG